MLLPERPRRRSAGQQRQSASACAFSPRFGDLLCDQKDAVAAVISREAGKPEAEALSTEILVVLDTVKYLRNNLLGFLRPEPVPHGNPAMKLKRGTLLREPYGVVGIISPWNYPFSVPSVQTLTALATGNAVALKPSEFTPYLFTGTPTAAARSRTGQRPATGRSPATARREQRCLQRASTKLFLPEAWPRANAWPRPRPRGCCPWCWSWAAKTP